jgi:hypothetical protein
VSTAVLVLGFLLLAATSLAAAWLGWRALLRDPRLRAPTRIRDLHPLALRLVLVASIAGVAGGIWLATQVQAGNERHSERRR